MNNNNSKTLYLLRGCPASGKSTWISQNKLEPYTISSDKIRMLFPFSIDENGKTIISLRYDDKVWKLLYELMEERMKFGQPIIIDATHYRGALIKPYLEYTKKYGYNIEIIDFTMDITLEELKDRNSKRQPLQVVPDEVIDRMFEAIKQNDKDIKKQYKVVNPNEGFEDFTSSLIGYSYPVVIDSQDIDDLVGNLKALNLSSEDIKEEIFNQALELFSELKIMKNFDQNNKYHDMTLDMHTMEVIKNIPFQMNSRDLYLAALFHDIGKPLVAKLGKDNHLHFYNHAKVGADLFKNNICRKLRVYMSKEELDFIEYLIKHHDDNIFDTFIEDRLSEGFTKEDIKKMLLLQMADAEAHVREEKTQLRVAICDRLLKEIEV